MISMRASTVHVAKSGRRASVAMARARAHAMHDASLDAMAQTIAVDMPVALIAMRRLMLVPVIAMRAALAQRRMVVVGAKSASKGARPEPNSLANCKGVVPCGVAIGVASSTRACGA